MDIQFLWKKVIKNKAQPLIPAIIIVLIAGCGTSYKPKPLPLKAPSAYSNALEVAGATVGARAFDDPKNARDAFGFDVLGAGMLLATQNTERETIAGNPPGSQVSATSVTYPVELFADGKARHFRYKADDAITIQYFILKSSDGVIRAAFDACDVCWPAGKGSQQSGDVMVCRNCGRKFASIRVNEVKGGCNPAPLERKIEGEKLVLQAQDILSGKKYFDFSNRG